MIQKIVGLSSNSLDQFMQDFKSLERVSQIQLILQYVNPYYLPYTNPSSLGKQTG